MYMYDDVCFCCTSVFLMILCFPSYIYIVDVFPPIDLWLLNTCILLLPLFIVDDYSCFYYTIEYRLLNIFRPRILCLMKIFTSQFMSIILKKKQRKDLLHYLLLSTFIYFHLVGTFADGLTCFCALSKIGNVDLRCIRLL